ncbi:MAG: hypothetical protein ABIP67_07360 [Burkholderiales bacterium]
MDYFVGRLTKDRSGSRAVRHVGNFQTLEAAIKSAQILVDDFLLSKHQPDMTAADLFSIYKDSDEVPVIFSDADSTISVGSFNHFRYATLKCKEIC